MLFRILSVLAFTSFHISALPLASDISECGFPYFSKADWGGRPAIDETTLVTPAPYVVIHHTYIPEACYTTEDCMNAMRSMQDEHQLTNGWTDIGYNFAVGSNGAVYEGRGWSNVGAHAVPYNSNSIGIAIIGDWRDETPPKGQLESAKMLIELGVEQGVINEEYQLVGHLQISDTECPGQVLLAEISGWHNYFAEQLPL